MKAERPRIAVRVEAGRLVAMGPMEQEIIDKLPLGRLFVEISDEEATDGLRNFFFAGINLLFDNTDGCGAGGEWPTPNHLRRYLLIEIGFCENILRVDGIKKEPRSMARGSMTADEIKLVTELSRAYCVARWGFDAWTEWESEHQK